MKTIGLVICAPFIVTIAFVHAIVDVIRLARREARLQREVALWAADHNVERSNARWDVN
jgi:hypothetical protein